MKHGRKIGLVNFYTDEVADLPKKCLAQRNGALAHKPAAPRRGLVLAAVTLLVIELQIISWRIQFEQLRRRPALRQSDPPHGSSPVTWRSR